MKKISSKFLILACFLCSLLFSEIQAQRVFSNVKKISHGRGTLFGNFGWNRAYYTEGDISFKAYGYDFSIKEGHFSDKQSKSFSDFLSVNTPNSPQYNLRMGYYFRNKMAFSLGVDHIKYIFDDGNAALLSGTINQGIDSVWSGEYNNQAVITNRTDFHLENRMNYISLGLMRTEKLFQARNKTFALCVSLGIGMGGVLSSTDFNFEKNYSKKAISMSGFQLNAQGSVRLEFFQNFFVQGELSGNSVYQNKLITRKGDLTALSKQHFLYGQRAISVGFLLYFKPINGCDSCPVW